MGQVGAMEFEDLAAAVMDWPLYETYDLLKAMILCLRAGVDSTCVVIFFCIATFH